MNKKNAALFSVLVIGILCVFGGFLLVNGAHDDSELNASSGYSTYELGTIKEMAVQNDYTNVDINSIVPAQEMTGNLSENVKGNAKAPVLIFEYADYQCSSCAAINPRINQLVKDYDGKVAVVLRTYILPYHSNGVTVASAANAAAIQGYWEEYSTLLFANQNDWSYAGGSNLQEKLENYFMKVAGENGDLEQFRADMNGEAVAKKIAFDQSAGNKVGLGGTPWFYIDGEWVDNTGASVTTFVKKLRQIIDEKLAKG